MRTVSRVCCCSWLFFRLVFVQSMHMGTIKWSRFDNEPLWFVPLFLSFSFYMLFGVFFDDRSLLHRCDHQFGELFVCTPIWFACYFICFGISSRYFVRALLFAQLCVCFGSNSGSDVRFFPLSSFALYFWAWYIKRRIRRENIFGTKRGDWPHIQFKSMLGNWRERKTPENRRWKRAITSRERRHRTFSRLILVRTSYGHVYGFVTTPKIVQKENLKRVHIALDH